MDATGIAMPDHDRDVHDVPASTMLQHRPSRSATSTPSSPSIVSLALAANER